MTEVRASVRAGHAVRPYTRGPETVSKTLASLEMLAADGRCWTDVELRRHVGNVAHFLTRVSMIPWLRIDRKGPAGTVFEIDRPLQELCTRAEKRPALGEIGVGPFLAQLRAEIRRRRKENHDERGRRRWSSDLILMREQTDLLDWIETQLDRVPDMASPVPARHITVAGGVDGLHQDQRHVGEPDPGAREAVR